MLHLWLIPVALLAVIGLIILYAVIKSEGGSGERSDGRTVTDKPMPEETRDAPWNVYDT